LDLGTMVSGAPPIRGGGKKAKCQRGKDRVRTVQYMHCKYCTHYGKSLEEASNCPGKEGRSMCMGREGDHSLECMICNSITKCRYPMSMAKGLNGASNGLITVMA
jgi:hypothetical protein